MHIISRMPLTDEQARRIRAAALRWIHSPAAGVDD